MIDQQAKPSWDSLAQEVFKIQPMQFLGGSVGKLQKEFHSVPADSKGRMKQMIICTQNRHKNRQMDRETSVEFLPRTTSQGNIPSESEKEKGSQKRELLIVIYLNQGATKVLIQSLGLGKLLFSLQVAQWVSCYLRGYRYQSSSQIVLFVSDKKKGL